MSGFLRTMQPASPLRDRVKATVSEILCLEAISAKPLRDPFNVADPCPFNPTGHQVISSCGEQVCWHCAKIFWS